MICKECLFFEQCGNDLNICDIEIGEKFKNAKKVNNISANVKKVSDDNGKTYTIENIIINEEKLYFVLKEIVVGKIPELLIKNYEEFKQFNMVYERERKVPEVFSPIEVAFNNTNF